MLGKEKIEEDMIKCEHIETAEEMFAKVAELIQENFVAIYEKQGNTLLMRSIGGGVRFRIIVEKIV